MKTFNFQPVIVIGAARSGTNMLRDLLTQLPRVATWPCDEINYVWRYGNAKHPTDELTLEMARPRTIQYIRKKFAQLASQTQARWIVEKTCANSLRVDFVREIVPEAKFIFLVRNGLDAAASANKRWHAELDLRYLLKKVRYVPMRDVPFYASRYLVHRWQRLRNRAKKLPTWGPRFSGLDALARELSCTATCVRQWKVSVESAARSLARLPATDVYQMSYEDFVQKPGEHLQQLCSFLQIPCEAARAHELTRSVFARSVGIWKQGAECDELSKLEPLVLKTLAEANQLCSIFRSPSITAA